MLEVVEKPVEVVVVKEDEGLRRRMEIEVEELKGALKGVQREKEEVARESEERLGVLKR